VALRSVSGVAGFSVPQHALRVESTSRVASASIRRAPPHGHVAAVLGMMRREVLDAVWFTAIRQARMVINHWLGQYNKIRPQQTLNIQATAPETLQTSGT
jgi:hypothetical protein